MSKISGKFPNFSRDELLLVRLSVSRRFDEHELIVAVNTQ